MNPPGHMTLLAYGPVEADVYTLFSSEDEA